MEVALISNFMFYVKGLLNPELANEIIEIYKKDSRKHPGFTVGTDGEKQLETTAKVSTDLEIKKDGIWKEAREELHASVTQVVQGIVAQSPSLQVWPVQWSGYKIQHYKKDEGHFKWHFDALGNGAWERQLAMIIYLNSVADGGETAFLHQNLKIKPVAGDALFFPPFWTHLHTGEIPKSEDKYIISSFVTFKIPAKIPALDEKKSA